jgi:PAS domain S-box-containing protein
MANEAFYEHFRVSPAETENCLVYDLGDRQWNIPRLKELLEEILPRRSFFRDFEVTHDFPGLGRRTILLDAGQLDHVQRILLSFEDVTERLHFQAEMRRSELRYRRLFEAAQDGILIIDPVSRKVVDANPFMAELLGHTREELLGKELWQLGLLKDEQASQAAFRELQTKGFIGYADLPLQTKTKRAIEVEFVSNVYEEGDQKIIQCSIRDITARKAAEEALRQAQAQLADHASHLEVLVSERTAKLQEMIGELDGFSYSITHDLRAPLRAMQSFSQILEEGYGDKFDEAGKDFLRRIAASADRMDKLILDVLAYSRVLRLDLRLERVDPERLLRGMLDLTRFLRSRRPTSPLKASCPTCWPMKRR